MALAIFVILNSVLWVAIIASAILWARFLLASARGKSVQPAPVTEVASRRPPFWGPADFLVMFGTMIFATAALRQLLTAYGWINPLPVDDGDVSVSPEKQDLLASIAISIASGLFAFAVSLTLLLFRRPNFTQCIRELGWVLDGTSVRQGLWAAIWFLPPIAILSLAISAIVPYEHPVMDALAAEPTVNSFLLLTIGTVLVAPLVEEFMFRVLLQGGLQSAADPPDADSFVDGEAVRWRPRRWWPILVTSVFFAMMHVGQGAAPVPLFFLSLALGYLYRQTGSVIPSLVLHMMLNGITMLSEFTRLHAT